MATEAQLQARLAQLREEAAALDLQSQANGRAQGAVRFLLENQGELTAAARTARERSAGVS